MIQIGTHSVLITLTIDVGLVGCKKKETIEVDREEWEGMTPAERDEYMQEELWNHVEWGYEAINE